MSNDLIEKSVADIAALLQKRTGQSEEMRILDLFRPLTPEQFIAVLSALNLNRLLSAMDWWLWGVNTRAEFLQMLEKHVGGLNLETKVLLTNLLADGPTGYREERVLRALFLSCRGAELTELKLRIDMSDNGHDLLDLLTGDIDSPELRYDILKHFKEAAEFPKNPKERVLRVVSDIDDTLYCSLNDHRHPRGKVYDGVLELYSVLSPLPPIFLTARPEMVSSLVERLTHRQLRRYGLEKPTVLSGNLTGLMGHRRMAEQKARTLTSYMEMYPEFRFVFFGDSGQGDLALSESLLASSESVLERAFIHKLSEFDPKAKSSNPRVHLYSDYGTAAVTLHSLGYLDVERRDQVLSAVRAHA